MSQFTEAGAARQLDEWVLGHALSQIEAWNRSRSGEARPVLTVNLTRASVQDPGLVASIRALLVDHAVDPCQLLIEVAEPNLSDDPGAATATLDEARRLGLTLVVDDFGTGHTSIERLQRFGFGVMKIDGSLVDELDRDGDRTGFVAALSLAAALDMTAVAEGVERVEQVQALLHHGCMYAQGHLFCAPVGADRLGSWLDRLEM